MGPSFVRKENDDAAQPIVAGGYFGQSVDLGDAANKQSEVDLIGRYREMSLHPECDSAIADIVNELSLVILTIILLTLFLISMSLIMLSQE